MVQQGLPIDECNALPHEDYNDNFLSLQFNQDFWQSWKTMRCFEVMQQVGHCNVLPHEDKTNNL